MINKHSTILITAPKGLTPFLSNEVKALNYTIQVTRSTGVEIEGTIEDCMRLNLHLRTAHHVLFLLNKTKCRDAEALYKEVYRIDWQTIIPADGYFSVVSHVVNPTIRDTRYANVRCKDAIVDRINDAKGRRPDSGSERKGAVVTIHWVDQDCSIYLDTSGEPLSKRGYRKIPLDAPMQETLAAGVILASGWDGKAPFVNPMCGSGTLAIEAALIACNRAPGLTRRNFAFMHLLSFNNAVWTKVRDQAVAQMIKPKDLQIIATDIKAEAISASRQNAETAGVGKVIQYGTCEFDETAIPEQSGVVVLNPEYGIRMQTGTDLKMIYKRIGNFFKRNCPGYKGYVFTGNEQLISFVGLKSSRKKAFYSGKLECNLYEYDIYKGKKTE